MYVVICYRFSASRHKILIDTVSHMPYDEALPLRYNRAHYESLIPNRNGWIIGMAKKTDSDDIEYGRIVKASSDVTVYDPQDLIRHTYVLGSSGCGKTTLLLNLYSHVLVKIWMFLILHKSTTILF